MSAHPSSRFAVLVAVLLVAAPCVGQAQSITGPAAPVATSPATDSAPDVPDDSSTASSDAADPGLTSLPDPGFSWHDDVWLDTDAGDHVGVHDRSAPYRARPFDRTLPAWRYNRVEGPTVGLHVSPLSRSGDDRAKVFGQVGYAFELEDIRYTAGVELRVYDARRSGLKVGALYQEQTVSEDVWKTSPVENSITSLVVGDDLFDYYEAEGATAYATQYLPGKMRLTAGFRVEEHRPLQQVTGWSIFADDFTVNPGVERRGERLHAALIALDGGRIRDFDDVPSGYAFRASAELGDGVGGDLAFNRYTGDVRAYVPFSGTVSLGLRARGGYATSATPLQKQFTLGGVGSMRGYAQNVVGGTRTLLGNAELIVSGARLFDDVLNDVFLIGFADAGWVGASDQRFSTDDVLPSAGFGIGLPDRQFRLDVAWPLKNLDGAGFAPSIRIRLSPAF